MGLLPSIGKSGSKRKASFIQIIQIEVALVCLLLEGFQLALATGKGVGIAPLFYRLSSPFPSKTRLFGSTFQGRDVEGLLGLLGKAIDHSFQGTRLVLEIWPGECLLGRRELARAAATRLIMQAFRSGLFPFVDPSRHGDAMDLRSLGNILDRLALRTQQ
jgi:hypothetical protein